LAYLIGAVGTVPAQVGADAQEALRSPHPAGIEPVLPALLNDMARLTQLAEIAEAAGGVGNTVASLALPAVAPPAQGRRGKALTALERALALAEPEGYMRTLWARASRWQHSCARLPPVGSP
jgi:hypothetical protein